MSSTRAQNVPNGPECCHESLPCSKGFHAVVDEAPYYAPPITVEDRMAPGSKAPDRLIACAFTNDFDNELFACECQALPQPQSATLPAEPRP